MNQFEASFSKKFIMQYFFRWTVILFDWKQRFELGDLASFDSCDQVNILCKALSAVGTPWGDSSKINVAGPMPSRPLRMYSTWVCPIFLGPLARALRHRLPKFFTGVLE